MFNMGRTYSTLDGSHKHTRESTQCFWDLTQKEVQPPLNPDSVSLYATLGDSFTFSEPQQVYSRAMTVSCEDQINEDR